MLLYLIANQPKKPSNTPIHQFFYRMPNITFSQSNLPLNPQAFHLSPVHEFLCCNNDNLAYQQNQHLFLPLYGCLKNNPQFARHIISIEYFLGQDNSEEFKTS
jgi:hypothetical protein